MRRTTRPTTRRTIRTVLAGAVVASFGFAAIAPDAQAATAVIPNGVTTTDLNAVGMSPTLLAQSLVGTGVTVSNVTFSGANAQAGSVHLLDPAIVSFNDGVILSSGNIADVLGPNKSDSTTGDMAGPSDADLTNLIANTQTVNPMTYDAASLEFDFVPTTSQVYFTYTFGSDEYLEWVNLFNDVFAFYVNGQNCATVPNGDPVSIDTINSAVNTALFRDNSFSSPPANPINIESDGLSVELICSATVNAGQTNHMKLAIADTSDQILDSVVMIKAGSFGTTKPESCNDSVDNDDDALIDMEDPSCGATTTPPAPGSGGIGSSGNSPAFTGSEGTPIVLDASTLGWTASPDALTATWTVTGINGTPGTCDVSPAGAQAVIGTAIPVAIAVCPNEGEYVARVEGIDVEGHSAFDNDVDFFVQNAPPAVTIDTPVLNTQVEVGTTMSVAATVTDPGVNDSVTCDVDWGDGVSEALPVVSGMCSGDHVYASPGVQVLAMTATDNAADTGAAATVVESIIANPDIAPTITAQPAPVHVVAGQPYAFSASADGVPAPTVQWQESTDGGTTWTDLVGATTATLSGTSTLAMNGSQYHAVFTNAAGSVTSDAAALTVVAAEVTLTASTITPVTGQPVVLTASIVDSAMPSAAITGKVVFYDGATVLATKAVSGGIATLSTTKLGLGAHSVSAVFKRTAASAPLSSNAVAITVGQPATAVTLKASPLLASTTRTVTLRAKVVVQLPGKGKVVPGTVTFYDGETPIATVTLTTATATFRSTYAAGVHTFTAVYNGSATLQASAPSAPITVTVA